MILSRCARFIKKVLHYAKYKLYDQWHFLYFAFPAGQEIALPRLDSLVVRKATLDDLPRIKQELFSFMKEDDGDKEYFKLLDKDGAECFLVEKDGVLVNFTWLFTNLTSSPIMKTPISKKKLRKGDAFIGPLFTIPPARGVWIFPAVLGHILKELKEREDIRRALVFVYDKNPGAASFYERLGFERL